MFKVIIFDLVGVFSEHENVYAAFKKVTGFKGTVKSLQAYVGAYYEKLLTGRMDEVEFWNKLKDATRSRKGADNLKKQFLSTLKPAFRDAESFNKVKEHFKVALVSNFVHSWWVYLKSKYNLNFDYEVLSSSAKIKKPDSRLFLYVPMFFKVKPEDCVYVSDEAEDMDAAKKLGMETLFIPGETKAYKGADYTYQSVQEFIEALI